MTTRIIKKYQKKKNLNYSHHMAKNANQRYTFIPVLNNAWVSICENLQRLQFQYIPLNRLTLQDIFHFS